MLGPFTDLRRLQAIIIMADLTKIPTVPPPPGVRPNFVDPVKNEGRVVEIVVAFTVISMIFMALRLSTRYFISHALGLDDGEPSSSGSALSIGC